MLQTLGEAYKVQQLRGDNLSAVRGFYMATLGSAEALYLEDRIGTFAPGYEADITILDPHTTPLLDLRSGVCETIDELLFVLMTIGDDRAVKATYLAGDKVYSREDEQN
jgi:guanine deaminase